jgi:hypothetical protein
MIFWGTLKCFSTRNCWLNSKGSGPVYTEAESVRTIIFSSSVSVDEIAESTEYLLSDALDKLK